MDLHIDTLSKLVRGWHSAHEIMGAVGSYVDSLPRQYVLEWLSQATANYPPGYVRAFGVNLSLAGGRSPAALTVAASLIVIHTVRSR